jgi:hypothetical protein
MPQNPATMAASAAHARATRTGTPEEIAARRADLAAAKIEDFVRKTLADAPPIPSENRTRIARLLSGGDQ